MIIKRINKLEFGGGENVFREIRTNQDIQDFLEKCNCLHDGYIIDVHYINQGISKIENGHYFEPDKTFSLAHNAIREGRSLY